MLEKSHSSISGAGAEASCCCGCTCGGFLFAGEFPVGELGLVDGSSMTSTSCCPDVDATGPLSSANVILRLVKVGGCGGQVGGRESLTRNLRVELRVLAIVIAVVWNFLVVTCYDLR